jgi:hypothetical protein
MVSTLLINWLAGLAAIVFALASAQRLAWALPKPSALPFAIGLKQFFQFETSSSVPPARLNACAAF